MRTVAETSVAESRSPSSRPGSIATPAPFSVNAPAPGEAVSVGASLTLVTLTLSGTATVADYRAALRSVTYSNTSDTPSTLARAIEFVADDGTDPSAPGS